MRGSKRRCGDRSKTISDCRHEIRWVVFSSIYCAFCCSALKLCWWSLCLDWWMICLRIQSQWFGVCSWSGEQFQKIKSWFNLPLFSYAFVHSDSFAISSCVCVCVFFVLFWCCFVSCWIFLQSSGVGHVQAVDAFGILGIKDSFCHLC